MLSLDKQESIGDIPKTNRMFGRVVLLIDIPRTRGSIDGYDRSLVNVLYKGCVQNIKKCSKNEFKMSIVLHRRHQSIVYHITGDLHIFCSTLKHIELINQISVQYK